MLQFAIGRRLAMVEFEVKP